MIGPRVEFDPAADHIYPPVRARLKDATAVIGRVVGDTTIEEVAAIVPERLPPPTSLL